MPPAAGIIENKQPVNVAVDASQHVELHCICRRGVRDIDDERQLLCFAGRDDDVFVEGPDGLSSWGWGPYAGAAW